MKPDFDPTVFARVPDPFESERNAVPEALRVQALPRAPTRARAVVLRGAALVLGLVWLGALVLMKGLRAPLEVGAEGVAYGVLLPLASAAVLWALVPKNARRQRVLFIASVALLLFSGGAYLSRAHDDASAHGVFACVGAGFMMVLGPFFLVLYSMRHAFALGATWRTAALGLAMGLFGAGAARLYCPNDAFVHVLLGHGLPILVLATLAGLFGPRVTRA